jgi:hypothetical protein
MRLLPDARRIMAGEVMHPARVLCPSAQPDWKGSVAIGVVRGPVDAPRLAPFDEPVPVSVDLLRLVRGVPATEVFRFAAPCAHGACAHYASHRCHLVEKAIDVLPPVTTALPSCAIRPACRWYRQEGEAACVRCPQVITDHPTASPDLHHAADPAN